MKYKITSRSYKGKIGVEVARGQSEVQLKVSGVPRPMWFNIAELEAYEPETKGWKKDDSCILQIDGYTVRGIVTFVADTYLKIRVNADERFAGREVVRSPDAITYQDVITERTVYRLTFRKGPVNFRSLGNQDFNTLDELKKFVYETDELSEMSYTKITTRTEPARPINVKITYEF